MTETTGLGQLRPTATVAAAEAEAQCPEHLPLRTSRRLDEQKLPRAEDEGIGSGDAAQRLAFRARALAQAHPLSDLARRFVDRAVATERLEQPMPEIGIWAGAALMAGYCLRRVEETTAGGGAARSASAAPRSESSDSAPAPGEPHPLAGAVAVVSSGGPGASGALASWSSRPHACDLDRLDERAALLAVLVRRGETASFAIADPVAIEAALDRLVYSAVATRLQQWADDIDDAAWGELEEYLTW